jgi:hypothetical protein
LKSIFFPDQNQQMCQKYVKTTFQTFQYKKGASIFCDIYMKPFKWYPVNVGKLVLQYKVNRHLLTAIFRNHSLSTPKKETLLTYCLQAVSRSPDYLLMNTEWIQYLLSRLTFFKKAIVTVYWSTSDKDITKNKTFYAPQSYTWSDKQNQAFPVHQILCRLLCVVAEYKPLHSMGNLTHH